MCSCILHDVDSSVIEQLARQDTEGRHDTVMELQITSVYACRGRIKALARQGGRQGALSRALANSAPHQNAATAFDDEMVCTQRLVEHHQCMVCTS